MHGDSLLSCVMSCNFALVKYNYNHILTSASTTFFVYKSRDLLLLDSVLKNFGEDITSMFI